ncbi:hypothetical protein JAAARDRAFT_67644 [Jaapia argillacea MUCL 33604]|uniref:Uncharacterized protein n=1 Tax=Jaapia argillacea MUCL 33604 TaxID=933084 RepID=A0A067Q2T5_9AGAM|nr:hypothetical protein JAAARDRAFT_67644 [Jaapia argillacea MUCL 33604]
MEHGRWSMLIPQFVEGHVFHRKTSLDCPNTSRQNSIDLVKYRDLVVGAKRLRRLRACHFLE